jgi:asparagine synthetase B (glutamine-hydrolysing)
MKYLLTWAVQITHRGPDSEGAWHDKTCWYWFSFIEDYQFLIYHQQVTNP